MIKNFYFWDYKLEPPEWALEEIGVLEEQRYENQTRIAELEDANSEIYNPPPEGD